MASSSAKCNKGKGKNKRTEAIVSSIGADSLQAYPVPFSNNLHLNYGGISHSSRIKIKLTSVDGKQYDVSSNITSQAEGRVSLDLDNARIASGMYVLQLQVDEQAPIYIRIVKQQK